ncbi:RnfABCDGE type electron transport complex subunit D [Geofilum sp. OHC36d9]|uniref:RnfABCDGE type electron transport complex subunit D n=1 Tax=Geofilum sp. OHC36d9 TaxID=3458413 RepID=UPI004033CC16
MRKLIVSPSPHVHSGDSIEKNMYGVVIALLPALAASLWFFGLGALIVTLTSVAACLFFEFFIQKYFFKKPTSITDGSALITGLLLAFNLPSNMPVALIIIGAAVAIGIGKMTFGGLGNNPFNPALVGRVFLLIAFPVQMTSWPIPLEARTSYLDAVTGATPLSFMKEGLFTELPSYSQMLFGQMGGSAGEISAIALLLGLAFMLYRRIITWHIPVAVIGSIAVFTGALHLADPVLYATPLLHILTGGALLGAIFMATDYATSPMSVKGMWIYGIGIGLITVLIRVFGSYPEGMSFAILIMNAFTPLIDNYIKPKRFGEKPAVQQA